MACKVILFWLIATFVILPVTERPIAVTTLEHLHGDFDRITQGRKGRVTVDVNVQCGKAVSSTFTGTYLVLPVHDESTVAVETP